MRKKDLLLVSVASLMLFTGLFSVKAVSYVEGGVSISQEYDILLHTDITNPYYEPGNNGYTDLTQPYKVTDSSHLNSSQPVVTVDLTDFGLTTGAKNKESLLSISDIKNFMYLIQLQQINPILLHQ